MPLFPEHPDEVLVSLYVLSLIGHNEDAWLFLTRWTLSSPENLESGLINPAKHHHSIITEMVGRVRRELLPFVGGSEKRPRAWLLGHP
jgi:hypothetical protein